MAEKHGSTKVEHESDKAGQQFDNMAQMETGKAAGKLIKSDESDKAGERAKVTAGNLSMRDKSVMGSSCDSRVTARDQQLWQQPSRRGQRPGLQPSGGQKLQTGSHDKAISNSKKSK